MNSDSSPRGDAVEDALVALHRLAAMFEAREGHRMDNEMVRVNAQAKKSMIVAELAEANLIKSEGLLAEASAEKITKQTLKQVAATDATDQVNVLLGRPSILPTLSFDMSSLIADVDAAKSIYRIAVFERDTCVAEAERYAETRIKRSREDSTTDHAVVVDLIKRLCRY